MYVEVNWTQFGGFMHKMMGSMEDALSCKTVEHAFKLFEQEHANIGKTEHQQGFQIENFTECLKSDLEE